MNSIKEYMHEQWSHIDVEVLFTCPHCRNPILSGYRSRQTTPSNSKKSHASLTTMKMYGSSSSDTTRMDSPNS